jgi:hypothetical protein
MEAARRKAPKTIDCMKSEIEVRSSHEKVYPFAFQKLGLATLHRNSQGKSARKISRARISRNPLISLDSDERIQGNPRKSNPENLGFSQRNSDEPRKPKPAQ